ncbi:DUF1428 domain-containing protein [Rhodobacter ferrooxidans]|uniref:RNA signal recognition particle 4.5S RNA n=1 Tax=Rhodobacter ferrooxidans TaxID=371731 RepID=C8S0I2_9RHOB|nr:DUF1428 domain-containing protein [Rhodobacter sp. SW2]EEW25516.1 protein of unknown function DUF1428 [Rhodobacter sp. SW2]
MAYVDGFVASVPDDKKQVYIDHAAFVAKVFHDHGALQVVENWGDDVPEGKLTSFPMAVQRQPGETVVFSWVVWPSREARVAGWAAMDKDDRMAAMNEMPFDGKRMIYGGFTQVLNTTETK